MRKLACALALVSLPAVTATVPAGAETTPTNVPVSPDRQFAVYQQPSVAVDPTAPDHVVAVHPDVVGLTFRSKACHLARSIDGGATWTNEILVGEGGRFPPPPERDRGAPRCSNLGVAFGPDGTLYVAYQSGAFSSAVVYLLAQDPDGTFREPVPVAPLPEALRGGPSGDIFPDVAADPSSDSVHVTFTRSATVAGPDSRILLATSTDRGRTFEGRVVSPPTQAVSIHSQVAVGPDGRPYVLWIDMTEYYTAILPGAMLRNMDVLTGVVAPRLDPVRERIPPYTLYVASPSDGQTLVDPVAIAEVTGGCPFYGRPYCTQAHYNFDSGIQSIAGGPDADQAIVTWWDPREGFDRNRAFVSRTVDGGRTWSEPRQVLSEGLGDGQQHRSRVAVAPNGRIDVASYHIRADGVLQDVYLASSDDGGATFSAPGLVTDTPSDVRIGNPAFYRDDIADLGQHLGLASTDAAALVGWTDTRRGTLEDGHQDVYFARVGR